MCKNVNEMNFVLCFERYFRYYEKKISQFWNHLQKKFEQQNRLCQPERKWSKPSMNFKQNTKKIKLLTVSRRQKNCAFRCRNFRTCRRLFVITQTRFFIFLFSAEKCGPCVPPYHRGERIFVYTLECVCRECVCVCVAVLRAGVFTKSILVYCDNSVHKICIVYCSKTVCWCPFCSAQTHSHSLTRSLALFGSSLYYNFWDVFVSTFHFCPLCRFITFPFVVRSSVVIPLSSI